jgi:hypothetical protein
MAVQHGFGASITEGLTFAYDTIDTTNSYLGEPTTNLFTNPAFTSGTSGWTFGSWDSVRYTYTVENIMGPFGEIVPALKVVRTTADTSFAHFHQNNGGKFTNGNTYTISAWVKGSGTLGQYNQGGYGPITYSPSQFTTLTNDWQRVSYTLTSQTNSLYPYWAAEGITQNVPMYFTFAQAEQKPHVTQFVNGTRSATQGLLDLTGNSSIDLSTMSFNPAANLVFDGTDDYISTGRLPADLGMYDSSYTAEAVVYPTSLSSDRAIFGTDQTAYRQGLHLTLRGGQIYLGHYSADMSGGFADINAWNHIVYRYDISTNTGSTFKNGVLQNSADIPSFIGTTPVHVGREFGNYNFGGEIPVAKIYNRALSQAEVTQNFKKYQTRFGIA